MQDAGLYGALQWTPPDEWLLVGAGAAADSLYGIALAAAPKSARAPTMVLKEGIVSVWLVWGGEEWEWMD